LGIVSIKGTKSVRSSYPRYRRLISKLLNLGFTKSQKIFKNWWRFYKKCKTQPNETKPNQNKDCFVNKRIF